ncbi:hypothetical protein AB7M16_005227 [Bradyrhizobium sp. USDA 372]
MERKAGSLERPMFSWSCLILAGIARRAGSDRTEWIKARTRTFTHAVADLPRNDPLVQQVIGRLFGAAFGARAALSPVLR